jgi:hypothetical protein
MYAALHRKGAAPKAFSQLLSPDRDREVWFSLEENHEEGYSFGLHQLRNCRSQSREQDRDRKNAIESGILV